jgi:hypothetical protein
LTAGDDECGDATFGEQGESGGPRLVAEACGREREHGRGREILRSLAAQGEGGRQGLGQAGPFRRRSLRGGVRQDATVLVALAAATAV